MSRLLVKLLSASMVVSLLAIPSVQAQNAMSLSELLRRVEQGSVEDNKENQAREQRFRADKAEQNQLLKNAEADKVAEEKRSQQFENKFESNQVEVDALEQTYTERLGDLKELFGVMQQVAGDARANFDVSLTNIQYPDRGEKLGALAKKIGCRL
jgi:biopolymer transport protein ExbB